MPIVGFNFLKINAEKKNKVPEGKVNIANDVSIKDVEETSFGKNKGVRFTYYFCSNYNPDLGKIELEGDVFFTDKDKIIKDIISSWEKNKKVPEDITMNILDFLLVKCNTQSIILSKELNLPPPIPFPKIDRAKTGKEYIG